MSETIDQFPYYFPSSDALSIQFDYLTFNPPSQENLMANIIFQDQYKLTQSDLDNPQPSPKNLTEQFFMGSPTSKKGPKIPELVLPPNTLNKISFEKLQNEKYFELLRQTQPTCEKVLQQALNQNLSQNFHLDFKIPWPTTYEEKIRAINEVCRHMQKEFNIAPSSHHRIFKKRQKRENLIDEDLIFEKYTQQTWGTKYRFTNLKMFHQNIKNTIQFYFIIRFPGNLIQEESNCIKCCKITREHSIRKQTFSPTKSQDYNQGLDQSK